MKNSGLSNLRVTNGKNSCMMVKIQQEAVEDKTFGWRQNILNSK